MERGYQTGAGSGEATTDHGDLEGLGDDDHTIYAKKASNLSDLANAGTARTNLGLGTAATHAHGDYDAAGTAAALVAALAVPAFQLHFLGRAWSNVNWATVSQASSAYFGGVRQTDNNNQNNEVVQILPSLLQAGTWDIILYHRQANSNGIYTVAVSPDGSAWTDLTTIDGYAASTVTARSEVTGLTIAANMRYLRLKMATKNASSPTHAGNVSGISGVRTGA